MAARTTTHERFGNMQDNSCKISAALFANRSRRSKVELDLTRSSLRGIQRRCKDQVRKERIGTLLKQLETRETAFGDHRKRLDRYIAFQLGLAKA